MPATGLAQVMLMLVPLIEKLMPSGTPEIETLTEGEVASAMLIVLLTALPATPLTGVKVTTGPATEIFTV